jgi:hypothetical protein
MCARRVQALLSLISHDAAFQIQPALPIIQWGLLLKYIRYGEAHAEGRNPVMRAALVAFAFGPGPSACAEPAWSWQAVINRSSGSACSFSGDWLGSEGCLSSFSNQHSCIRHGPAIAPAVAGLYMPGR